MSAVQLICASLLFLAAPGLSLADAVLHRAGLGSPRTLDSQKASSVTEVALMTDLFTGLLTIGPDGGVVLGTAVSMAVSHDKKTYRFELAEGLVWSDGMPLTADDYVHGLRRLMDPNTATPIAAYLYCIVNAELVQKGQKPLDALGIRRVGEQQIEVTLEHPAPYFAEMIALAWGPAPRHAIDAHGADWAKPKHHVSNGPFKVAEWVPNQHVKFVKDERFFAADGVALDAVYHYPGEDLSTALRQFRAGELHIINAFPAQQLEWVRQNLPDALRITPSMRTESLQFNTSRPPLDDPKVRLALSMAINRELIVSKILRGDEKPAYSVIPPGASHYPVPADAPFSALDQPQRLAQARALLTESGFGPDNPLQVEIRLNASETRRQVAIAVASMWKQIGVQTQLLTSEDKARLNDMRTGNYEIVTSLRLSASTDGFTFLNTFQTKAKRLNTTRYYNPAFDDWMRRAAQTADLEERAQWVRNAETQLLADQPIAPIYRHSTKVLVSAQVQGWLDSPTTINPSRYLSLKD